MESRALTIFAFIYVKMIVQSVFLKSQCFLKIKELLEKSEV